MGCLPLERTTNVASGGGCIDKYNDVAIAFNQKLNFLVEAMNKDLSGLRLVFTNPYVIVHDIIQNPSSFGKLYYMHDFFTLIKFVRKK